MVESLADGRVGLIAKVHHAVVDGVAGAQLMAQLLDLTPEGSAESSAERSAQRSGDAPSGASAATESPTSWLPARLPSGAKLLTDALPNFVTSPMRVWRAGRELGHTAARLVSRAVDRGTGPVSIPLGAPDTFEAPVGPRREVAFAELDLRQVRALCERFGVKVNDVVLAICSGALRSHLADHGEDVGRPLVAVVPVSTRDRSAAEGTGRDLGNQLSAMFVPLSNERETPLDRLRTVAAASASRKGQELDAGFGPAIAHLERALSIRETREGDPADRAQTQLALAEALWRANAGRLRAADLARRARDIYASMGSSKLSELAEAEAWLAAHRPPAG